LRLKKCLVAVSRKLWNIVASKLILDWSPKRISGWLKTQHPADPSMRVSHETIYRSLFIQARGVLKKELMGAPNLPAAEGGLFIAALDGASNRVQNLATGAQAATKQGPGRHGSVGIRAFRATCS
jgi:hypothetical protein